MELQSSLKTELDDDDKLFISEAFHRTVVPKLKRLHARLGTLNCEFARPEYGHWSIRFRSAGPEFEIVDFEYDETGAGLDLDL
jgi:hypothetical protein